MNVNDPYSAPKTGLSPSVAGSDHIQAFDFKKIRKLYHRSCNVNAIAFFLALGIVFLVAVILMPNIGEDLSEGVLMGLAAVYIVALIGIFRRTSWGRIMGIIACIQFLIYIPIGSIIGIVGLFAFIGAPQLFGTNRVTHRELKSVFKLQKADLKAQRRKGG